MSSEEESTRREGIVLPPFSRSRKFRKQHAGNREVVCRTSTENADA